MIECVHCERKLIPSTDEINICPYCGHATGEGMLHLSTEEEIPQEDQLSERTLIRTMGKLSLLVLILGVVSFIFYGLFSKSEANNSSTAVQGSL